jgi:hypothetical protein
MTNRQKNKRSMYKAVIACCNLNITILSALGAFAAVFTKLKNLVSQIDTAAKVRNNAGAGTYNARDKATETLIDVLIEVAAALFGYASEKNLADVRAIADIRPSKLEATSKVELEQKAKDISELAVKYAENITNYGTDAEKIAELQAMIATFSESEDAVDTGLGERAGAVQSLGPLIRQTDTLLTDQLDKMVLNLKRKQPKFFAEYTAARVLHDRGGSQSEDAPPAPATTTTTVPPAAAAPAKA